MSKRALVKYNPRKIIKVRRTKKPIHKQQKRHAPHKGMSQVIVRNPTLIPDRTFAKLKYTDNKENELVFGGTPYSNIRTFRGNGVFDPDTLAGSNGCYGYNQYAALYNKVRVYSSKIIVRCINVTNDGVFRVTLWPSDLAPATSIAQLANAATIPYAKSYLLPPNGSRSDHTFRHYMSTCKMEGDMGAEYDTTFASNTSNIPSNQWFWNLSANNQTGQSVTNVGIVTDIQIIYYCEFYSRKDLTDTVKYFQAGEDPVEPIEDLSIGQTGPSGSF